MKWTLYEIYKNKSFILITLVLSFAFVSLFWNRNPVNYSIERYNYFYFFIVNAGILFISTRVFAEDIKTGAIKILFTSSCSRINIFFKRLINILSICIIFFLGAQIMSIISMYKLYGKFHAHLIISGMLSMLLIYVLNICMVVLYVGIITFFFKNQKTMYILAILPPMVMRYFIPFLKFISIKTKNFILEKVLSVLPTTIVINWSTNWEITLHELFIFITWLVILYVVLNLSIKHMAL